MCPYRPGEHPSERHIRRLRASVADRYTMAAWCQERGLTLTLTNHGHHWQIRGDSFKADWWPSSAKLVIQGQWERGVHAHDYRQVIDTIERERNGA